ncbi:MAG TPA: MATE family efflux transporter [Burkholderiales bacterium]|nr:MATE family efflux transporter [Burkholderiales bacterium]
MNAAVQPASSDTQRTGMSPRTRLLLEGPIVRTLLRLAWPNILVMLIQASTGLIETWWVSRLGTAALAGMALVFPGFMMMQMLSAGAVGGGISSAIARALGSGRRTDADALVWHALIINTALGIAFSLPILLFGPSLYRALGGQGASLDAALSYSNIVFAGCTLVWLLNALASVLRGTGNMLVPSVAICAGVFALIPLSPIFIFGVGPLPALGMAGAGIAVVLTTALTAAGLAWYIWSGRAVVRPKLSGLRKVLFVDILRVGAVGSVSTLQTTLVFVFAIALVGAGGPDAVAGYGTGARLEYLLIPLVFGLGAPLVALVGTNIGAGQRGRALRIALVGGALAFVMTEVIGLLAAFWPRAWLGLFTDEPRVLQTGSAYLHIVGPAYGLFGLGLSLYFASQGAGRLLWPLLSGFMRMAVALGGGALALYATGSLHGLFAALAAGLAIYGVTLAAAIRAGVWFERSERAQLARVWSLSTPAQ